MADTESYSYTFKILAPDLTPDELEDASDNLLDDPSLKLRDPVVSTSGDQMTLTVSERTADPVGHFPSMLSLAKLGMAEFGITHPIVIEASVAPVRNTRSMHAHLDVVGDVMDTDRIDLTDELLRDELNPS